MGVRAALTAASTTILARRGTGRWARSDPDRWVRINHRGEPITLLEGPAVAAGLVAGVLASGARGSTRCAAVVAVAGAATFGLVDDLAEDGANRAKGLRGHLGALAHGELTTGGLKVLGIGATGLAAAALARRETGARTRLLDVALDGALVAGYANLANLLDLRPGRALKATAALSLLAAPTPGGFATPAVIGAAAAAAPGDLGERDMLGDCGANALGALIGVQIAVGGPRAIRAAALGGVVALTVASERVSFSKVIDAHPVLHRIDSWGRRPRSVPGVSGDAADGAAAHENPASGGSEPDEVSAT